MHGGESLESRTHPWTVRWNKGVGKGDTQRLYPVEKHRHTRVQCAQLGTCGHVTRMC